jgi:DNA-binding MarR family transcriptional regulator
MGRVFIKHLPRYENLLEAAKRYPDLDPTAAHAFLHLLRAGDDVIHSCATYMTENGLTQGRFVVLMQLLKKMEDSPQSHTPAELAKMSGVTRATMTGLIDTLERDGLVKRAPDAVDRRMTSVRLTERGHRVLQRVLPGHFRNMARIMKPLSDGERKTLVRLLTKIMRQVDPEYDNSETSCALSPSKPVKSRPTG